MKPPRHRPTRAPALAGVAAGRRWLLFALALTFFGVESLALAPAVHAAAGHACTHGASHDTCDGDGHGHVDGHGHAHAQGPDGARNESEAPDPEHTADGCALCRVLAAVPTPIALPPVLPRPEAAPASPEGASAAFVPACVLALGLARGPPSPTRR